MNGLECNEMHKKEQACGAQPHNMLMVDDGHAAAHDADDGDDGDDDHDLDGDDGGNDDNGSDDKVTMCTWAGKSEATSSGAVLKTSVAEPSYLCPTSASVHST